MTIRSARSAALLLTATAIGALALAPEGHAGAADSTIPAPSAPGTISVPEGHHVSSRYDAAGFQVYKCSAAGTWTLHAPRAALWNRDTLDLGKHFGGPQPGSIPWLRLTALDTAGSGVFSEVTYIHRVDTSGGVAPAGSCDADRSNLRPVPYAATYFFYEHD